MNQILKSTGLLQIRFPANSLKSNKKYSTVLSKDVQSGITQHSDLLINNIKNAKSITGVLELVDTHNNVMNPTHTIQALRTIFLLQKRNNSALPSAKIVQHPTFEKICNQLKYYAGSLELNDTIEALKVMSLVGVSSQSTIYQILLQLIRHNVNQMSLQQIIFVDFILSKAKPSPLVEALQIALPIVYDIQLPVKLDQSNLSNLPEHLHYMSRKNISEQSVILIVNALMETKVFNGRSSISILWSLCDMEANPLFEPLFNKAIKSLLLVCSTVPYNDMETVISKMVSRYSKRTPFYYNESFFDLCATTVINEDLGFEHAVHLLKKFIRLSHANKALLEYISEKCFENPSLIEDGDPILVANVIHGCALTEFKPKHYDAIKESFLNCKNIQNYLNNEGHLIKLQTSLAVLNIYIPEIVEKILNKEFLTNIFTKNYASDFENVLLIIQAIKAFKPEFNKYVPDDGFLQIVKSRIRKVTEYPLEGSLQHVFGGAKFIKTPALTKSLHHIDHLIVLRKGGFATALNPTDVYVEDISCESPNQIVLVLALTPFHYTINNMYPLGTTALMLQTLEAKAYSVVPICTMLWNSFPDFEKLPYLMEVIKSKTEHFDIACDISR